jgi:hypothetical protein
MPRHRHTAFTLPGDPTDVHGRPVDQELLGQLLGAAREGCDPCVDRLLDKLAADPVATTRLVEVSCRIAAALDGELPRYMTDDDLIPPAPEFRRLARAGEAIHAECAEMTRTQRRAAARQALDFLFGHLQIARERGVHRAGVAGEGQTLPEACMDVGTLMTLWWTMAEAGSAAESATGEDGAQFPAPEALLLTDNGARAVALVLAAVFHHLATEAGVPADQITELAFTPAASVLSDPHRTARIVAAFDVPPPVADLADSLVARAERGDAPDDTELIAMLRSAAAVVIAAHAADCAAQKGHLRQGEYTIGDRAAQLRDARLAGQTMASVRPASERHRTFPQGRGFRQWEPIEGPPVGYPMDHRWQIGVDRILLRRWDRDVALWNDHLACEVRADPSTYRCETGLEVLHCPGCDRHENLLVEGRWGEELTVHCPCGVTATTMDEPEESSPTPGWGRHTLKRLILSAADPAYEARRLHREVAQYQKNQATIRRGPGYKGPTGEEVTLPDTIDPETDDLTGALTAVLQPQVPTRHEGHRLRLLLVEVSLALGTPAVRDSEDGRRLVEAVRALLADLRQHSARFAPTRRVLKQLREWRDAGGPADWRAAWACTVELAAVRRFTSDQISEGALTDGWASRTTAVYLIARTQGLAPYQVGLESVRALADPALGERDTDIPRRWEVRLRELGHDLDDPSDPVVAMWRHLRTARPPSRHPGAGQGPAFVEVLRLLDDLISRSLADDHVSGDTLVRG